MKRLGYILLIAVGSMVGGVIGHRLFAAAPVSAAPSRSDCAQFRILTVRELRIVDNGGRICGLVKATPKNEPALILSNGAAVAALLADKGRGGQLWLADTAGARGVADKATLRYIGLRQFWADRATRTRTPGDKAAEALRGIEGALRERNLIERSRDR